MYSYLRHGVRDAKQAFDSYFSELQRTSITQKSPINLNSQIVRQQMLGNAKALRASYRQMPGDDAIYQDMSVKMIEEDLKELIVAHYQPSQAELAEATAYLEKIKIGEII